MKTYVKKDRKKYELDFLDCFAVLYDYLRIYCIIQRKQMISTEELVKVAESRTSEILESTGTRPPGTNKPK